MPRQADLIHWIEERVDSDDALDDAVGLLILAALEGDAELDDYLQAGTSTSRRSSREAGDDPGRPATGAFLRELRVTGFRGIGAAVTLNFTPGPGLTVVAGRNGSGKSSLAEGLELLLTGGTYRWKNKKSKQWQEQWRNLHHDGSPGIDAEIIEEGLGPIAVQTRWQDDAVDASAHTTRAQRTVDGTKGPLEDVALLGWEPALEMYRPMLSYDELGGLLEAGPSELYDTLAKVLGTEQLGVAMDRLKDRAKALSVPKQQAIAERKSLQATAAALDDERAQEVGKLLKRTSPDTAKIREYATGLTLPDDGIIAGLRRLARVESPDPTQVAAAAANLRTAVARMADAGEAESGRRMARLDLRRRALALHAEHGDQTCPVCTQGNLDDAWADTSRDLVAREESNLKELDGARNGLTSSRGALQALIRKLPAPLDRAPIEGLDDVVRAAREAWSAYEKIPQNDLDAADHAELHAEELAVRVGQVRVAAASALAERDDAWGPLATRVSAWCETWDDWLTKSPTVDRLKAAENWLKHNDTRLKNERIAPISEAAKHAWALLRQESNVALGDLRLEGAATRRRVAITASIDGEETESALQVMSQGELHALALALFLTRATLDESPFRFVILDDPVQAMDPAKVDGLVTLLSEIAETRQVIVFSHDDRLAAALRRTNASARILEVRRGPDSHVTIHSVTDPASRYLRDARALCKDDKVPTETLQRTLPGLVRMAVEAAARDRFFAARISRGDALADVEATWNEANGTRQRISLAIYDEVMSLDGWLRTESRRKGLGIATSGFHQGLHASPEDAVYHAERMVDDVRDGSR